MNVIATQLFKDVSLISGVYLGYVYGDKIKNKLLTNQNFNNFHQTYVKPHFKETDFINEERFFKGMGMCIGFSIAKISYLGMPCGGIILLPILAYQMANVEYPHIVRRYFPIKEKKEEKKWWEKWFK
jgi:hypothetical protein